MNSKKSCIVTCVDAYISMYTLVCIEGWVISKSSHDHEIIIIIIYHDNNYQYCQIIDVAKLGYLLGWVHDIKIIS